MQTCVIFNPSARGEKAEAWCSRAESLFPQCVWLRTQHAGHARDLAAQAARDHCQTIIAAGGDGTINEVVNGIGDVPGGLESVRLGILPLGTVNVLARELGLPRNLAKAAKILGEGKTLWTDLGRADYIEAGTPRRRFFHPTGGRGSGFARHRPRQLEIEKKNRPVRLSRRRLQSHERNPAANQGGRGNHRLR